VFRFVLGKLWLGNRNRPLDNNSAVESSEWRSDACRPFRPSEAATAVHLGWVHRTYIRTQVVANRRHHKWFFFCGFMKYLTASIYSAGFNALWHLRRRFPFLYPHGMPCQTPINHTRYKGLVSAIFARAFVFIQLIVCQVFQSVATGLAYRAFVILSRFSLKCVTIYFYASDDTRISAIRNSLLTHRNFFNHTGNVNYLITSEWPR